jgi:hypothetical protein
MKKWFLLCIAGLMVFTLFSCDTINKVVSGAERVEKTAAKAGPVDFKSGEVLCSTHECDTITDCSFKAAKILTKPSAATQNQAEVLFTDGKQKWVQYVVPSHKPSEVELQVGKWVLYMPYESHHEKVDVDNYRKTTWKLGRITSTDELFKDMVEIKGDLRYVKWIRVPDEPIE